MKIYGIAKKVSHNGHGESWSETVFCGHGGYYNNDSFHPFFMFRENAEKYLTTVKYATGLKVEEVDLVDAKITE